MNELGFIFRSENCIQCHACEAACKSWRQLEKGVKWRRVHNLWRGEYPQTSISTLSVSCMHCAAPPCVTACPEGAISKRVKDGLVLHDNALCVGCRKCYGACPVGAPQFGADGIMQKCDFCASAPQVRGGSAICALACPTQALESAQMSLEQKTEDMGTVLLSSKTREPSPRL